MPDAVAQLGVFFGSDCLWVVVPFLCFVVVCGFDWSVSPWWCIALVGWPPCELSISCASAAVESGARIWCQ